jgi:hypothetical protein
MRQVRVVFYPFTSFVFYSSTPHSTTFINCGNFGVFKQCESDSLIEKMEQATNHAQAGKCETF